MGRGAMRPAMDTGRAAAALGGDQRIWTGIGVVTGEPFVDSNEGMFVCVTLQPEDVRVCARVATVYSGDGFGVWFPLRAGEQVVVVLPRGDTFESPVVVGRVPSREEKPPTEFDNRTIIVKAKAGEDIKVITNGAGRVKLGDATGPKSAVRFEDLNAALQSFVVFVNAHTHVVSGTVAAAPTPPATLNLQPAKSQKVKVD